MMENPPPPMQEQLNVINNTVTMKRGELIWGVILYGVIMWAAGYMWASMAVL